MKSKKPRIREAIIIARNVLIALFFLFVLLAICSADGPNILFFGLQALLAMICFGVAYLLDALL